MSGGIGGGEGEGFDLSTKGQIHGYDTAQAAVNVGSDLQIVYADSAQAAGIGYGASARSTLASTGDILSCSAANVLSAISPATSGHVLTSNGASTLPSFQAAGAAGANIELSNLGTTAINANLTLDNGIDIVLSGADKIRFDGSASGDTYMAERTTNRLTTTAGGTDLLEVNGSSNYIWIATDCRLTLGGTQGSSTEGSIMYRSTDDQVQLRAPNDTMCCALESMGSFLVSQNIRLSGSNDCILDSAGDANFTAVGIEHLYSMRTYAGAGADDWSTNTATNFGSLFCQYKSRYGSEDVTVIDNTYNYSAGNFTFDEVIDRMLYFWTGSGVQVELSRSNNG